METGSPVGGGGERGGIKVSMSCFLRAKEKGQNLGSPGERRKEGGLDLLQ